MTGHLSYDYDFQKHLFFQLMNSLDLLEQMFYNSTWYEQGLLDILNAISYNVQLSKNKSFIQEEEHRLIVTIKEEKDRKKFVQFRPHNGAFIPYIELCFEENFPIESVTIGPRNNIDIAEKGLKMFLMSLGYKVGKSGVEIIKSNIPLRY